MLTIINNGNPPASIIETRGYYCDVFVTLLRQAGYSGPIATFDARKRQLPPLSSFDDNDTLLLTGSASDAFATDDWINELVDYVKQVLGKVKIVGVCFGHQVIARALDAPLGRNEKGWEVGTCEIHLTSQGCDILPILAKLGRKPRIMQMHRDIVYEIPANTTLLASSSVCLVQGFYSAQLKVLCFQGHPEFDEEISAEICKGRFEGEFRELALASARIEHDGLLFAREIVNFMCPVTPTQ